MKEFKKAGIVGVFVHPRPGLLTEYLSEDWFHLFDYTVQKGKEQGMKVWIYSKIPIHQGLLVVMFRQKCQIRIIIVSG